MEVFVLFWGDLGISMNKEELVEKKKKEREEVKEEEEKRGVLMRLLIKIELVVILIEMTIVTES